MPNDLYAEKSGGHFIDVASVDLAFRPISVADTTLTTRQILTYCDVHPREEYVVLRWQADGSVDEIRDDEVVNVHGSQIAKFIIERSDRLYRLYLNDRSIAWPVSSISEEILRVLGKIPAEEALYVRREDQPDHAVHADKPLSLAEVGVENVYSKPAKWELNVQGVNLTFDHPDVLVRTALEKAGFNPDQGWIIVLKTRDERRQVSLDEKIDLRTPGIEKLRLTPREINNGEANTVRRQFPLLPTDDEGLATRQCVWETITDNGRRWLILKAVELPAGYDASAVDIAIEIPSGYPIAELDMFYCYPHLSRVDGRPIPQTQVTESIEGRGYQRWSRHRGQIAPWRQGLDNVLTHLALIDAALLREVEA